MSIRFSSQEEYRVSTLWKVIVEEVLKRDATLCRARKCQEKAINVYPLGESPAIFLGVNPSALVSLCRRCMKLGTQNGGVLLPKEERFRQTRNLVLGVDWTTRGSQPNIGFWYRNQLQANQETAQAIYQRLKEEVPEAYSMVNKLLPTGKLKPITKKYLNL